MRKHRIWYGIVAAVWLVYCLVSEQWESLLLLAGLLVIPLLSVILQMLAMRAFQVEIYIRESCRAGQQIPLYIKIQKAGKMPLGAMYVTLQIENTMYDETYKEQLLLQPSEERTLEFEIPLNMEDCGNNRVTLEELKCLDMLGLFGRKLRLGRVEEILVHPLELQVCTQLSGNPEAVSIGESYSSYRRGQDVNEMAGLREYVPGDAPGSIHWKLSGKLDELIVREFGYPSNYSTIILYDLKKFSKTIRIPNAVNNAILALTLALSYQLLGTWMGHNIGWIQDTELQIFPVYSLTTHEQMGMKLLYGKIADGNNHVDTMYYFQRSGLRNKFTKLIYITSEYEEQIARQISGELDLTIIQVTSGKQTTYENTGEYDLISVNADDYGERILNIDL